ncbi:fungal pheromone STE3G-protein-coupled receptor [Dentipellis sp. KUC8613]|nr:fungal pheromone STE3G-protein-coupled receptor [Dentipellis sp. KUC8613]
MHHPEFPVVTLLSALALLFPLPWHFRAGNVAMMSMIFWIFCANVIYAVDSIIWAGNVDIVAVVWCDISTKVIIGANVALPAACLAVCIHLEQLASVRQALMTKAAKQRRQLFEAGLCFGLPVFIMAMHYTVQGHRFDIIEDYGCRPSTYVSWPAILLVWVIPLLLAVLTLGFATAAFSHFMRRRIDFARHLENRSALTTTRYMRLIIMSVVEMFLGIGITSYALWFATLSYRPYTSWSDVHFNFSRIDLYSVLFTPQIFLTNLEVLWWTVPISTWVFVLFFAFGHDAMVEYRACITWFRRRILRQQVTEKASPISSIGSKPSVRYVPSLITDILI